jgi:hypothetical protein
VEFEDVLKAVEKNSSGSRPKELFEDVLEEVEEIFTKERTSLKDAKLDLQPDTSFADFSAAVNSHAEGILASVAESHRYILPRWSVRTPLAYYVRVFIHFRSCPEFLQ